ncbi:MAG: type II toxin-antitoxin system Phd/YefM family antitoxin [bacterium]
MIANRREGGGMVRAAATGQIENLKASDVRKDFREVLNRVEYTGTKVFINRRGKVAGVLMPEKEYELFEYLLDLADTAAAKKALKDSERIPWSEVKQRRLEKE